MRIKVVLFIVLSFCDLDLKAQHFSLQDSIFKKGDVMISYELFFGYGQTSLLSDHFEVLDSLVCFMTKNSSVVIEVGVHTDERNHKEYSIIYSQIRAKKIVEYLIGKGISGSRLKAIGYEGNKPLVPNAKTEEEHRKNRRTEFKIIELNQRE